MLAARASVSQGRVNELTWRGKQQKVAANEFDEIYALTKKVKRLHGMQGVGGSSPPGSTKAGFRVQAQRLYLDLRYSKVLQTGPAPRPGQRRQSREVEGVVLEVAQCLLGVDGRPPPQGGDGAAALGQIGEVEADRLRRGWEGLKGGWLWHQSEKSSRSSGRRDGWTRADALAGRRSDSLATSE